MKRLVIVGCGHLAEIVANAVAQNLLPEYDLIGVYSRTVTKAERIASFMKRIGRECTVCSSLDELLLLKPDYLVETASPAAMKELVIPTLKNGTSIVTLSIGAFADTALYEEVKKVAKKYGSRVYIASGATGGFDVLRTAALMGNAQARFFNEKDSQRLRLSSVYDPSLETTSKVVFSGTAREAIAVFPTGLNVSVATSLASVGPEKMHVEMLATPGFVGDTQRVEIKNNQVHAVVDVYSATPEIAGWSVVSTLQNIVSPIVF
ncbi:MAG: aspartate dehydrogenase domain-containing protein [Dysgonomonas sp.]|nr:aspartate dehydrogenase domain-containing protein [Dysgonomonas sp.]